jgi:transposase
MNIKAMAAQGIPLSRIAAEFGIDRKTARRLRDADADPNRVLTRNRASRLAPYEKYIGERLGAGVPIAQIARDLSKQLGPIPRSTLWDFARPFRSEKPALAEEVRFETTPAQQAQCDWGDCGSIVDGGMTRALSLFVLALGYSRHTFACFTTSMDEISLQRSHAAAFEDFGGVPHAVLYDNMKTVTVGRDGDAKPIWQREFIDFAGRYGFTPKCARPYRAKTKGKVERTIGFIRHSFLPGREFTDLADANAQLQQWLAEANQRIHRTHGERVDERLARERVLLIPLRPMPPIERVTSRVVDAEGTISYEANRYELPRGYRGRAVVVRDDGRELRIFDREALICRYPLFVGRGEVLRRAKIVELDAYRNVIVERRPLSVYDEAAQ